MMQVAPGAAPPAMSIYVFVSDSDRNDGNLRQEPAPQDQMHEPFHKSGISGWRYGKWRI